MPVRRTSKPSADRILEAAERVFAEHAYGEVSLRQLMAAAGVSTTAFYARFDSKEAVLAALSQRLFLELHEVAPRVAKEAHDLTAGIELTADLMCELFAPRKALVRLILSEAGSSPSVVAVRRHAYALLAAFLAGRLQAIAERGTIAIPDPSALAWALIGALDLHVVRWAVWDELALPALRQALRDAARAILPPQEPR